MSAVEGLGQHGPGRTPMRPGAGLAAGRRGLSQLAALLKDSDESTRITALQDFPARPAASKGGEESRLSWTTRT
jgi:hypothetical protein